MRRAPGSLAPLTLGALGLLSTRCGPAAPEPFTVDPTCYAAGTPITIAAPPDGTPLELFYGPQGGQHIYPAVRIRGVDPRATRVRIELVRSLDELVIADQVFARFEPGEDRCDIAIPRTELFVLTPSADGARADLRITVFGGGATAMHISRDHCIASQLHDCGPFAPIALVAGERIVRPGDRIFAPEGTIELSADTADRVVLWGRIGGQRLTGEPGEPLRVSLPDRTMLNVELIASYADGSRRAVAGAFVGPLFVGCSPFEPGTCPAEQACRVLEKGSLCRAAGGLPPGSPCTEPDACAAGAECHRNVCRAYCDPVEPACPDAESCVEIAPGIGLCEPLPP